MENRNEKGMNDAANVTAADDTPVGYRGGVRPFGKHTASDGASGAVGFLDRLRRVGAGARALIREVCTFEVLGLCTMLLPALLAGVGFFFGQTVTPLYFYVSVAILLVCAFVGGWKRGVAYVALLAVCTVLTMFTFSYADFDSENYHFPMQHLLHHGWNPVFDSTAEKFYALIGGAQLWFYHALFLPKFQELSGAIVSSALHLFSGDGFLCFVLVGVLFKTSMGFAGRYWKASSLWRVLFACGMTSSPVIEKCVVGQVDYSTYASFCISALALVLYRRDGALADLVLFAAGACVCAATKTPGVLSIGILVLLTLPLLWKRVSYWRSLLSVALIVAIVAASPLLTAWVQYGSPFYPSMTFDPNVPVVDITEDLTGNEDALSMGRLSRLCYAWISPKLTVAAIRLLEGNPSFAPSFFHEVDGLGWWFGILFLLSVVLLAVSRKNMITWLCAIIFVSPNFVPLKFIGYGRYFPQVWAIFPLAVMNFVWTTRQDTGSTSVPIRRKALVFALAMALCGFAGWFLYRAFFFYGINMVSERCRQDLIATVPKEVRVDESFYRYMTVQRFRQAGITMRKALDGECDTVARELSPADRLCYFNAHMPHWDSKTSRVLPPAKGSPKIPRAAKGSALLCPDARTGGVVELYADMTYSYFVSERVKFLLAARKWRAIFDLMPHILWD